MSRTPPSPTPWAGIALKDRQPDHIRQALADQDPDVLDVFLRLHAYAAEHALGLTRLHHETSIPSGVLSPCFNGTYNGDFRAIADRIEAFFYRLDQKAKYGGLRQFVHTRLARTLEAIFEKTRIIRRIQLIESPEQLGKTTAARQYTAANNSGRTLYIQLTGGSKSICGDFQWALADALGIGYTVKLREKIFRIRAALAACDLVIIDEAHLIDAATDRAAADFWDYLRTDIFANGDRGIVLIATNHDLLGNLRRFRGRSGYNIGQLLGRMRGEVIRIDPAEDITEDDVHLLTARYYTPTPDCVAQLTAIARRPHLGHFGLLNDILNESWATAKAKRKPLTDAIVLDTAARILNALQTHSDLYK